jgi:hypothetical protein
MSILILENCTSMVKKIQEEEGQSLVRAPTDKSSIASPTVHELITAGDPNWNDRHMAALRGWTTTLHSHCAAPASQPEDLTPTTSQHYRIQASSCLIILDQEITHQLSL